MKRVPLGVTPRVIQDIENQQKLSFIDFFLRSGLAFCGQASLFAVRLRFLRSGLSFCGLSPHVFRTVRVASVGVRKFSVRRQTAPQTAPQLRPRRPRPLRADGEPVYLPPSPSPARGVSFFYNFTPSVQSERRRIGLDRQTRDGCWLPANSLVCR